MSVVDEMFVLFWRAMPTMVIVAFFSLIVMLLVTKRASLKKAGKAGGKLLQTVRHKAADRMFLLRTGRGGYATCWQQVQCQPALLVRWLLSTCPKEWHNWVTKKAVREMSNFFVRRSSEEKIAWKLDASGLLSGSSLPEVRDVEIHFDSENEEELALTANLRYSKLDGVLPLGLRLNCTGLYQGQVCDLTASITVLRLDVKVSIRITPYEDPSVKESGPTSPIPLFSYKFSTVECNTITLMPELLTGRPLDKEEEVKLKQFICSSCEALIRECSMKFDPPPPDFMRYSSGGSGSIHSLDEASTSGLNHNKSVSKSSLSQPIGGGMSFDILPKQLVVEVVEGHRLCRKGKDHSDAFCTLEIDGAGQKPQHTTVVKKSYSPEWNEALVFDLTDDCTSLTVSVYHHDVIRKNEFLGRAQLGLSHVSEEKSITKTLFLEGRINEHDPDVVMGSVTIRVQRKSIPQLSKLKHIKSSPTTSSTKALRDLRQQHPLSPSQSFDVNTSRPSSSLSLGSHSQSVPASPEEEDKGQLSLSMTRERLRDLRAESPAIKIEGPSDGSDEEAITEVQGYEAGQHSKHSPHHSSHLLQSQSEIDEVDFSDSPSESLVNGSLQNPSRRSFHGIQDPSHNPDAPVEADRLSSASGLSGTGNPFSTLVIETDDYPPHHFLIPAGASKTDLSIKGKKLHIYNNHVFQATHFSRHETPRCNFCEKEIRGFGKQAYRCRDCLLIAHKKCHTSVEETCPVSSVSSMHLLYHWETPI